jgi:hypothetical protein
MKLLVCGRLGSPVEIWMISWIAEPVNKLASTLTHVILSIFIHAIFGKVNNFTFKLLTHCVIMRQVSFLAAILSLATFCLSCNKYEAADTLPERAPMSSTFLGNPNNNVSITGVGPYEYGFKFAVSKNGQITRLGCKMPKTGNYRVTLWDMSVATPGVIAQATVVEPSDSTLSFADIVPVSVVMAKDYFISIWSDNNWYRVTPPTPGFVYPITTGSIIIKGYQWSSAPSTPQKFPLTPEVTYVAGVPDLEFVAD